MNNQHDNLVEAIDALRAKGYSEDFGFKSDCIECASNKLALRPEDFEIDEWHRFDGATNPADESIIYGISSTDGSLKGILIGTYGTYADAVSKSLLKKLSVR